MDSQGNGGSAFPSHGSMGEVAHRGMTLRDWFAGKVIGGIAASLNDEPIRLEPGESNEDAIRRFWGGVAKSAYFAADAMLAYRQKKDA